MPLFWNMDDVSVSNMKEARKEKFKLGALLGTLVGAGAGAGVGYLRNKKESASLDEKIKAKLNRHV
jgi:hypothetical protein